MNVDSSAPLQLIETILCEGSHRPPGACFVYQKIQRVLVSLERQRCQKATVPRDEGALRGSHNASIAGNIPTSLSMMVDLGFNSEHDGDFPSALPWENAFEVWYRVLG